MDNLEEYIRKNREDLDKYNPPSHVWRNIRSRLKSGKAPMRKLLSIAAITVIILGTALMLINRRNFMTNPEVAGRNDSIEVKINPQLKETEIYYNNLVNSLYHEATPLLTNNPEIRKELTIDIDHLDSICADIRKDLKDNVANQQVVEALIQNYRIKIRLLEDMLTILKRNENKSEKKKSYEL